MLDQKDVKSIIMNVRVLLIRQIVNPNTNTNVLPYKVELICRSTYHITDSDDD